MVQAAYKEIAERGFEGLRTREVAAGVGLNIATLHYYFPTKETLIRGVVEHAMGRFRSTLAPHGSPGDQLRNHLRAVRQLLRDEPELGAVMAELALRSARDPEIAGIQIKKLEQIIRPELALARRLYALQREDSRIGFEASNHYYYVPTDLVEKVLNCRDLLDRWPQ